MIGPIGCAKVGQPMTAEQIIPPLLTVREVAKRLRVCDETIRNEIRRGRLKSIRVGRQDRITSADLIRYIKGGKK